MRLSFSDDWGFPIPIERRDTAHTIMRSTRWKWGRQMVLHHHEPPADVDPYGVGFDQHDPANYTESRWALILTFGRWSVKIEKNSPRLV